jgi:uroporphyrinogen III methyltransferase/synthase
MSSVIRLLSRTSPLALIQVGEVMPWLEKAFPGGVFESEGLETIGDQDLVTSLTDPSVPTDFFTRELDRRQLEGKTDIVVHSAKDLPDPMPKGITIAAMLPARDTRDALCVREGVDLTQPFVIGTSSPVREAAVLQLYPHATCKPIRGSIGQRLEQMDDGSYDAVLIAGCALQRLNMEDSITEWMDYETTPLQGRLALTVAENRTDLVAALQAIDVRRTAGLVALVGCPAEAALLSPQAGALLDAADIILHDRLIPEEVKTSLGERGEYVGKKGHAHSTTQAHIHRRILHEAEQGKLVVRLHGGEPGVLGHLGETLDYCRAWNLRTQVVPAVSAAQITAARSQCSLTHRHEGSSITFLSGHTGLQDQPLEALAPERGHLAIYMGVRDLDKIRDRLRQAGWPDSAYVTTGQHLGSPNENLVYRTLNSVKAEDLSSPAVILVGPRPHPPSYTLFTGTDPVPFLKHGPLLHVPMISLHPHPLADRVQELSERLQRWDGLVFPSSRGVEMVMETLMELGDIRMLAGKTLLAVGPHTAKALQQVGLRADAFPSGFGGVSALVKESGIPEGLYGYPTSDRSPVEKRQQAVAPAGIQLDPWICYTNQSANPARLPLLPFHRVLFTSASTAHAYFEAFPDERSSDREWTCVGTSTQQALQELGLKGTILS